MKKRFVVWLVDFWCSKTEEGEEVDRSYFTMKRGKRDDFDDATDRETISVHDIDFLDVESIVTCDVIDVENKINEIDEVTVAEIAEDFFACFVRTCSCSLMLLKNLTEQRLHEKTSAFSFAIRFFSICCCLNCNHVIW